MERFSDVTRFLKHFRRPKYSSGRCPVREKRRIEGRKSLIGRIEEDDFLLNYGGPNDIQLRITYGSYWVSQRRIISGKSICGHNDSSHRRCLSLAYGSRKKRKHIHDPRVNVPSHLRP